MVYFSLTSSSVDIRNEFKVTIEIIYPSPTMY